MVETISNYDVDVAKKYLSKPFPPALDWVGHTSLRRRSIDRIWTRFEIR